MIKHRASWPQALTMLLACAAVFLAGYQLTLRHAMHQPSLPSSAVGWDAWVPFWPPSIVVYCSINLAYALAFLMPQDATRLQTLSIRLLGVQLAAFACFWSWPMRMHRVWPPTLEPWHRWFQWLSSFDDRGNLLPSLHVAILGVLWAHYRTRCAASNARWACDAWALCVLLSALTTWQHNLSDVLAGALLSGIALFWRAPGSSSPDE